MRNDTDATDRQQYLSFVLRESDYAVPIVKVKEILQYEGVTAVPGTPPSIRGVLNLRGRVVPVIDLGRKFGLGETAATRWTCVLVVEADVGGVVTPTGILADSVREVLDLVPDDIEPPPAFGTGVTVSWLTGMGKLDRRFVLLLDIDRVLAADEHDLAVALQAATAPAAPAAESAAGGDDGATSAGEPPAATTEAAAAAGTP